MNTATETKDEIFQHIVHIFSRDVATEVWILVSVNIVLFLKHQCWYIPGFAKTPVTFCFVTFKYFTNIIWSDIKQLL